MSAIEIRQHTPGNNVADFLNAAREVFREDPCWIPPLNIMMKDQLSPKSPFFQHADVALFTARRGGRLVGRISAQIDREHLKRYGDDTGFFGFFDTIDDERVAQALLSRAKEWVADRGMKRIRGPLSLSINQELGTLVEGFDTPPMVMMPHSRPHQDRVLQACGLSKAKDLLAWRFDVRPELPARCVRAFDAMRELGVTFRQARLDKEIDELVRIQDDAWKHNWGHVSMTPAEARQLRNELKLVVDPTVTIVVEVEGEIAGMALSVPNLNELIDGFQGTLSPLKAARLLWGLKVRRPKSARVAMLGLREGIRKQKKYMPLALALITELNRRGWERGYEWSELSWTLEDNGPVNTLIKTAGGKLYKRYRIYETTC